MCGIIGYIGKQNCSDFLLTGLKRLEYRGYDSAGIACFVSTTPKTGHFEIVKAGGRLTNIEAILGSKPLDGKIGIGHTRWATHGAPNTVNSHPHRAGSTVLVHNGIIENYESIREDLIASGYEMVSETDSELFGHLVEEESKKSRNFPEAVRRAFLKLQGSSSIVVVSDEFPDQVIAIRNGTPLIVAQSQKVQGCFVASDAQAILGHTNEITYLENEEMVICKEDGFKIYSVKSPIQSENIIQRDSTVLDWSADRLDMAGYPHFMLKEIYEQPRAILDTLDSLVDRETGIARFEKIGSYLAAAKKIQLVACGTAWHASLVGKYLIEKTLRIPVEVDLASEYRYRDPVCGSDTLFLAISQSGETADTLAALREAKQRGAMTAAICNVRGSTISREAGVVVHTAAGPEIGVASTKAFTTQVLVLMMLAQYAAKQATQSESVGLDLHFFSKLPHLVQSVLELDKEILAISKNVVTSSGLLFIGRGRMYPIALEGALKTKEITYIHAEGYPAGELKHGPIAMVDSTMTVVVLAPRDSLYEKTISNLQEVKARGAKILAIGSKNDVQLKNNANYFVGCDFANDWSDPLIATIPLQFLAYHMAVLRGTDVDRPRNLAKSVTVE
ncbi:MAG: glutamine--fructose-6-phosphate transaminase (isomerizing) [Bacteriovoracia bacterium]